MQNTWPTEEFDLDVVTDIIDKHAGNNGGRPLEMLRIIVNRSEKKAVDVEISDWVIEMVDYFRERYGYEHGYAVIGNILTKLCLQHENIH